MLVHPEEFVASLLAANSVAVEDLVEQVVADTAAEELRVSVVASSFMATLNTDIVELELLAASLLVVGTIAIKGLEELVT